MRRPKLTHYERAAWFVRRILRSLTRLEGDGIKTNREDALKTAWYKGYECAERDRAALRTLVREALCAKAIADPYAAALLIETKGTKCEPKP